MKIIIPSYSLPDNFTENVAFTLRRMGHEVLTAPIPTQLIDQRIMHIMQLTYEKIAPGLLTPQEKWLRKTYKEFKPDLMIALTHGMNEELLLDLRRSGVVNVAWWGDTAANMRREGLLCEGWDHIFIKDKYAAFKLRTLGLTAHFLPEAMNPQWHKKLYADIGQDIVFAGNAYDYRHYLVRRLVKDGFANVALYGSKPPRWAKQEVKDAYRSKYIVREEKSRIFGAAMACLNSTSMTEGNSVNCRTFELAGASAFQIMEYRPALEDVFEPELEVVTYSSLDELYDKLRFYAANPKATLPIREAAMKRAYREHTYECRLDEILKKLTG